MSSPDNPLTSRDSSDPDRCLQFPSSLAPVSSGFSCMWHFKLSGICKTIIICAIVNFVIVLSIAILFVVVLSVALCGNLN